MQHTADIRVVEYKCKYIDSIDTPLVLWLNKRKKRKSFQTSFIADTLTQVHRQVHQKQYHDDIL